MDKTRGQPAYSDEQLIENLRAEGSIKRKSEDQLFTTYSYFIREGMQKYSISEDESFEAYSDSLLAAIDQLKRAAFENRSSLKTWLYQIFLNKCVDLLRKKSTNKNSVHRKVLIDDWLLQLSDNSKSVIQRLAEKADWEALQQKLNELGENCRKLLIMAADGYSDKEISAEMEYKTADVVKTSRLRCLERLRKLYKQI